MRGKAEIGIALITLAFLGFGCIQVAGDEVGVRVCNIYKGVERKAKKTGTYFYIPGLFDFYIFPKTQQKLEMVESELPAPKAEVGEKLKGEAKKTYELELSQIEAQMKKIQEVKVIPHKRAEGRKNIRLKTADGNDVWVDVTVAYQIIENLAPVLVQKIGTNMKAVERLVGVETRGVIRQVLGELDTEEFYSSELREGKIEQAKELLNKKLNPLGIRINSLALSQFRFLPEYEDLLREKALAEQKRLEYEQLKLAAEKEREAKIAKAKGDADAMRALAEGKKEKLRLEGEAEQWALMERAKATQTKLIKEAQGLQKLTKSLAGAGGENLVARELARVLKGKKIIIVPGEPGTINIMNLNELLQTYAGFKALEQTKKTKK